MIRAAPARRAPCTAFSPTPPRPITTTLSPGRTRAVFTAAPRPVGTPQARRQALSAGTVVAHGRDLADMDHDLLGEGTAFQALVDLPPVGKAQFRRQGLLPTHRTGRAVTQDGQDPQDRISVTITRSPISTRVTPSPMPVTRPAASCP
jgi:hypothetical protein